MTAPDCAALVQARQQMLMARPWDVAAPESMWLVSGCDGRAGYFAGCVAMAAVGSDDGVEFDLLDPDSACRGTVPAVSVEAAIPLMLVRRDEPWRAVHDRDQAALDRALTSAEERRGW